MERGNPRSSFSASRPAVFLDRDGTMIEDVGNLHSIEQIDLFPDAVEALRLLQKRYLLYVITNQSGISQGALTQEQVDRINEHLNEVLRREGVFIQEWYVCPHSREDGCSCIKPEPEFVLRAQNDYGIDLNRSFVIGDHPHDALTANGQGVFGLYLLTGHGTKHLPELAMDKVVFHRISDAAEWIMNHPDREESIARQIQEGAEAIRNGGVAAFPTETVYGLGADVFRPDAVKQIFRIKGRPHDNPLIVHISDARQLDQLVTHVPDAARRLVEACWPGPLTIVLPKHKDIPDIVTGGHNTVAVRMPAHPIARQLIRLCGTPLAAPSANRFTCTSPTTAGHVREQLGDQLEVVIDGGACRVGVESTVVSLTGSVPVVLRPGGVPVEEIAKLIGVAETLTTSSTESKAVESPGMLPNHYAPATPLSAFAEIPSVYESQRDIGVLLFHPSGRTFSGIIEVLSKSGDTREAAANFFAALRRLDSLNLRMIVAEYAPAHGLGKAINNRLSKAAGGRT
ncbi:MAG: threonylcarbamoyl-AMP synthase [Chitinivibrionales bacterium]|nr:threonylcarbamoyl-AMP synthase [Chitinivibrionales bacterium]